MFHLLLGLQAIFLAIVTILIALTIIGAVIASLVVGLVFLIKGIRLLKNTERKKACGLFLGFGTALSVTGLCSAGAIIFYVVMVSNEVPKYLNH